MLIGVSIGVAIAMLIIMIRSLYSINFLYIIAPLVIIMVVLCKFCPSLFVAIAFDSGGVAAGSLSASFVLPFVIGICSALNTNSMLYAFGTIAIIAIIPTIVIQIMGVTYQRIVNKNKSKPKKTTRTITIIDFD